MSRSIYNYPSPAEIKVYINNAWVDDVYRLDYTLTNQRTPLYDYTSQFFKGVAEGNSIIQGQIIINFRFPGYLEYAIKRQLFRDPNVLRPLNESANAFQDLLDGSDIQRIQKLLAYKKAGALNYAKQVMSFTSQEDRSSLARDELSLTHKMMPFNIRILYGGAEAAHVKILEDCYIIGESQTISASAIAGGDMSSSGMPVYEIYSFFAKKLVDEITERGANLSRIKNNNQNQKLVNTNFNDSGFFNIL